ncbi:MAG: DinB family protein [Acidimicrobiales bacterium]
MTEPDGDAGDAPIWMAAMTAELILDSLQRRMRALHSLYTDAVATMDADQVNHFERDGVVPIAFSLFHIVNMVDASFMLMTGTPPIWDETWNDRVKPAIPDHGKHRSVEEMVHQRIGDYGAFQEYLHAVFDRVEAWLADLDPAELTRTVITRPFPEQIASTYSARVAGPHGITVLDATECWIYQHALRHMGEIELARGLVGLGGMTS